MKNYKKLLEALQELRRMAGTLTAPHIETALMEVYKLEEIETKAQAIKERAKLLKLQASLTRYKVEDFGSKLTVTDTRKNTKVSVIKGKVYHPDMLVLAAALRQQLRELEMAKSATNKEVPSGQV